MAIVHRAVVDVLAAMPARLLWRFARRYVAGTALDEALRVVRDLNAQGVMATLDILGEQVGSPSEARAGGAAYGEALQAIRREGLLSNISVKPTHLGLKLAPDLCLAILRDLVREAHRLGNFVRLDMEDSTCTEETLRIYRTLVGEAPAVGVALQAYLKRSRADAARLAEGGANVRVCKGIYREAPAVAFQDRQMIRENFLALLEILLGAGCYVGIATHDPWLIQEARDLVARRQIPRDRHEFQMLLGVRSDLRAGLLTAGERVRVYVPFGENWRAYCLRRFRENPTLLRHVMRALFRRERPRPGP